MPTYNFKCSHCGNEKKELLTISEMDNLSDLDKKCEYCSKGFYEITYKKPPGIQFKGGNFYSNS